MIPTFKIIPDFNNRFLATCEGKIYDTQNECFLELKLDKHKWRYYVNLPGFRAYKVHQLVAWAYHGKPPFENVHVHHDNEDKLDNRPQNLVYLTHSVHTGLHSWISGNAKKMNEASAKLPRTEKQLKARSKPVLQFTKDGKFVNEYYSAWEAARQTGIAQSGISNCCNGKRKSAGGFKWQHASPQIES